MYSNSCCSCSFEPDIIKIGQSSHKMYSKYILKFQESTTIFNTCTKNKSGNLLKAPRKRVRTFPKSISPKVNIIARPMFELAYYDIAIHPFNHYDTETHLLPNIFILLLFTLATQESYNFLKKPRNIFKKENQSIIKKEHHNSIELQSLFWRFQNKSTRRRLEKIRSKWFFYT